MPKKASAKPTVEPAATAIEHHVSIRNVSLADMDAVGIEGAKARYNATCVCTNWSDVFPYRESDTKDRVRALAAANTAGQHHVQDVPA